MNPSQASSFHSGEPPVFAQDLLKWLVPVSSEESIPGDLLEEYRENVRPSRGERRANLWYFRQVAGFLWRLSWMFVILNATAWIVRSLFDTFAPPGLAPHSYQFRSALSTYSTVGTCLLAGLYAGYRTGQARAGLLTAAAAAAIGLAISLGFDVVLFYTVIQHDPVKLNLFYVTGGWDEALGFTIIIPAIAAMLGLLGGLCGKYLGRVPDRRLAA